MGKSEKLGILWNSQTRNKRVWRVDNISGFYHSMLRDWWDYFGLEGSGILVGESGKYGENVKSKLQADYPNIKKIFTVDLIDADINCDIQKNIPIIEKVDWIICQAVLEHLADPFGSMVNMLYTLKTGGVGFFHTVGPSYGYHAYPIDCCRFFRDIFFEWEKMIPNVIIEDIMYTIKHCFVVYKKV